VVVLVVVLFVLQDILLQQETGSNSTISASAEFPVRNVYVDINVMYLVMFVGFNCSFSNKNYVDSLGRNF